MSNPLYLVSENKSSSDLREISTSIVDKLCYECGIKALPFMYRSVYDFASRGLTWEMLDYIISLTTMAYKPSYAYFDHVARFCIRNKLFDPVEHALKGKRLLKEEREMAEIFQ